MKKIIKIFSIAICLCLTGCNIKADNSLPDNINFITQDSIYYKNGCIYGKETATFLDFDTLERAPLCAVPNCTHNTSECLAKIVGDTPVFYNDYIYYFESNYGDVRETSEGAEFYIDSKLKKAKLESSATEVVCEFHDCAPQRDWAGLVLYGNELYFTTDDLNPVEDEYGGLGWGNSGGYHFLCSINLDTGEYQNHGSIYDGDKKYDGAAYSSCANITGVYKDKMYIRYSFIKDNEKMQAENADIDSLYEHMLFEFDFNSKTWKEAELPFSWWMNERTYTYYDDNNKEMHVIYKDNETFFPCDNPKTQFKEYNGKLFVLNEGRFYELNNMTEHNMGEYADYEIMGYYNDCYILRKGSKAIRLTEEELLKL